ncbi:dual specificity protein phosphatase family protein [Rhizobium halophytocola]|uniref:Protein tyrosine/serine phosphatase n=1 Tax=Rhizobium halophytocola TaxID=735519 RepID=A0ABS4E0J1_9HYPH|nr:dual specificity protein phosphatase family protein [Rhizobium halophytocola]MBP1851450.1 protein tyrosine/serine phosphatase [Rhizobium halophytocola]
MLRAILKQAGRFGAVVLVSVAAIGGYCGYLQYYGNLHTVIPGQVYRSAQPSAAQIDEYASEYGIKSIINLRGENDGSPWYDTEIKAADARGIRHFDFRMSARRELSSQRIRELTELMRTAPKPLLIHCKSGADRTGLASVIYLHQIAGVPDDKAEGQLSLYFGHFSIPLLSQAYAMDASWEKFENTTGFEQLASAEEPAGSSMSLAAPKPVLGR